MVKTKKFRINSLNIIELTISHNGYQGGDSGHGGFVEVTIENYACTAMFLNGQEVEKFTIRFEGDCERDTLETACNLIANELFINGNRSMPNIEQI